MADLRSLLTVFGPLGVIGILLIAAAPIGLAGINPLDAGKLATSYFSRLHSWWGSASWERV